MKSLARVIAVAILGLSGLAACNNDDLPPAQQVATVQGTVIDGASKQPIAGATITIDTVLTATSDANGNFKIERVPVGIVDYTVQAQGHKVAQASTTVEPGKPFELDVALDVDTSKPVKPPLDALDDGGDRSR